MGALEIHVQNTAGGPGWTASWHLNGAPLDHPLNIAHEAAAQLLDQNRLFSALFENHRRPLVEPAYLRTLGQSMFAHWFAPAWGALQPRLAAGPHALVIHSTDRDVLNLPWELVELTPDLPIGCDAAWSLRRTPLSSLPATDSPLLPGPLRILFLAAAPTDQQNLDYEREEDAILTATGRVRDPVELRFADTGTVAELADLVAEFRPHVVHLSGHGVVEDDGNGTFAFEREDGRTDSQDANRIVTDAFRGSRVRCVFLNGCQTAKAAVAGLCQHLVSSGLPLAIGWAASVADDLAIDFAAEFYRRAVHGEPISSAAAHARETIRRSGRCRTAGGAERQDATFSLPQLYTSVAGDVLYDRAAQPEPQQGTGTVRFLLGDGIKGLTKGYVGRRREGQRLIPALREGQTTVALLTGIGGAGKSTLATRAANRLRLDGFHIVPLRVEPANDGPAAAGRLAVFKLIDALARGFLAVQRPDLQTLVGDGRIPTQARLGAAIDALNDLRLLLVLDNLEEALDVESRTIVDPDLAAFFHLLTRNLTRGSRAIVTCRYLPADTPLDQPTVAHFPLSDFPQHDVLKFLRRDPEVDRRLRVGVLKPDLVQELHAKFGGTPRFLEDARRLLGIADPEELQRDIAGIEPGDLTRARDLYYEAIITTRLYAALSPAARALTSRVALSELPLPPDALARLSATSPDNARASAESAVEYGLLQRFEAPRLPDLYHPPGLLRPWLIHADRLPGAAARTVHGLLAQFWRESYDADREAELRAPIHVELLVCRAHARTAGDDATFCWASVRLARGLADQSAWNEARDLLEEVPEAARDDACWHELATLDVNQGHYAAAREKFAKSLEMRQAIGDRAGEAATIANLGAIDVGEGSYAAAREKYKQARDILHDIGDRAGEAAAWHQLASIDVEEGHYAPARQKFAKSLAIKQAIGDRAGEAVTWHQLASIDVEEGHYAPAREKFAKSLEIEQAIGDRAGEAATIAQLGAIHVQEGSYSAAREKYEQARAILHDIGDRAGEAATWHNLATIDLNEGHYAPAREKFAKALEMRQAIGDRAGEAVTWHQLASIDVEEGHYAPAREKFAKALEMLQTIGDRAAEAATFFQLGVVLRELERADRGAPLLAICWMIDKSIGHGEAEQDFRTLCGVCAELGYDQARFDQVLDEAQQAYKQDGARTLIAKAFAGLDLPT